MKKRYQRLLSHYKDAVESIIEYEAEIEELKEENELYAQALDQLMDELSSYR